MGSGNQTIEQAVIEVWNDAEMQALGKLLANTLKGNEIILLQGPLGAGKTTLSQGIGLGLALQESILSPTFVLIREYGNPVKLMHIDLYRIETVEQLESLGIHEILNKDVIRLIEWADKFPGLQQWADQVIDIAIIDDTKRKVTIHGT